MVKLSPQFEPMLKGCLENRTRWVEIEEGKEDESKSQEVESASETKLELVRNA